MLESCKVEFSRHQTGTSVEYISGSMALLHQLLWLFKPDGDGVSTSGTPEMFKKIEDFEGYRKFVALGLLEASLSRILIFDERLFDAGNSHLSYWENIDINLVTVKDDKDLVAWREGETEKVEKSSNTLTQSGEYDFVLCHESMLKKIQKILSFDDVWNSEGGAVNNRGESVIGWLQTFLKAPTQEGRLIIHTGRGKPDKLLEQKNGSKEGRLSASELDNLRFVDFVNLRYAIMNGKYFLVQLCNNLRRGLDT